MAVQEVAKPAGMATETALPAPPATTASTSSATDLPAAPPAVALAAAAATEAVIRTPDSLPKSWCHIVTLYILFKKKFKFLLSHVLLVT